MAVENQMQKKHFITTETTTGDNTNSNEMQNNNEKKSKTGYDEQFDATINLHDDQLGTSPRNEKKRSGTAIPSK